MKAEYKFIKYTIFHRSNLNEIALYLHYSIEIGNNKAVKKLKISFNIDKIGNALLEELKEDISKKGKIVCH